MAVTAASGSLGGCERPAGRDPSWELSSIRASTDNGANSARKPSREASPAAGIGPFPRKLCHCVSPTGPFAGSPRAAAAA